MSQLYTIDEVAKLIKVSGKQVRRYIDLGELKSLRFGRLHRITEKQLEAFVKSKENS